MGKRRTKRRRKGGTLSIGAVAKLKVKTQRLLESIREHIKLNAHHKAELYVGKRPKNKENVSHLKNHQSRQTAHLTDALLTHPNTNIHIVGVAENGVKFISDKGGKLVETAGYGAEVGKRHGEQFMKDFNVEKNIAIGLEAGKDGLTMLADEISEVEDLKSKIEGLVKNIYFGDYVTGFVRRGKQVFTFIKKKGGNVHVKGSLEMMKKTIGDVGSEVGSKVGEVGKTVAQGVGNVGSKVVDVGTKAAQGVGTVGKTVVQGVGRAITAPARGIQYISEVGPVNSVITGIKFGGKWLYKGGKLLVEGGKVFGKGAWMFGKGLVFVAENLGKVIYVIGRVLYPFAKILGKIGKGLLFILKGIASVASHGGRRTRRKKRKRIKRKRTKKNRRKRKKKTRRRKSK